MTHIKFQEYLNSKGKVQTSGKVQQVADFEGSVDSKPAKEKMHKDAGGKGQDGPVNPYKGGVDAKDPNKSVKDGFAHKGDKKLKYEPDTKVKETSRKQVTWPKTKTQEWIDHTKDMSLAEFTKSVRSEALKGLSECQDSPHNSIKETVSVCKCNKKYVSALVREMKRNGLFGNLMKEMVNHPETFKALAIMMEKDETYARKFAKALSEMVAPPMGDDMPMPKKKHMPMGHMNGMGDEDMGDMGDDEEMGDDEMGDDEMGDMGDDEMGDDEMGDMGDDEGMEDEDDMSGDGMGDEDMHSDDMPPKKHAHHNLMKAMQGHPSLMGKGM